MKIMKAVILTNDYEPNEDVKCKEQLMPMLLTKMAQNEIEEHEESIVEIKDQSEKDNDIAMNKMKKLNAETNVKGQC